MSLLRRRRGVSGIISGVFAVVVTVMLLGTLYWQFSRFDVYGDVVLRRMDREWERNNERIVITSTGYGNKLRFKVLNEGAVTAHLVELWLNDTTTNTPGHYSLANYITSNCSAWIGSGMERWIYTTIPVVVDDVYDMKIATERGNITVVLKFRALMVLAPAGVPRVGFVFNWQPDDFQYIVGSETWSNPRKAWTISYGNELQVVFRVQVVNGYDCNVALHGASVLNWVWFDPTKTPTPGTPLSLLVVYRCFILNAGSTPSNYQAFSSQNIGPAGTTYIYFGATTQGPYTPGQPNPLTISRLDSKWNGDIYIFFCLYYTLDVDPGSTVMGATVAVISCRHML